MRADKAKTSLVESLILEPIRANNVLALSLVESVRVFLNKIISVVNSELESGGKYIHTFKVESSDKYPSTKIDDITVQVDLKQAQDFAQILWTVKENRDVKEKVAKSRELWNNALPKQESFLKNLREKVIRSAIASQYRDKRLWAGECDDCKDWKQELASLGA